LTVYKSIPLLILTKCKVYSRNKDTAKGYNQSVLYYVVLLLLEYRWPRNACG